jgi:hypothetical protein
MKYLFRIQLLTLVFFMATVSLFAQVKPCSTNEKWGLCKGNAAAGPAVYDTIITLTIYPAGGYGIYPKVFIGHREGKVSYMAHGTDSLYAEDVNTGDMLLQVVPRVEVAVSGGFYDLLDTNGKVLVSGLEDIKISGYDHYSQEGAYFTYHPSDTVNINSYVNGLEVDSIFPLLAKKNGSWGALAFSGKQVLPFKSQSLVIKVAEDTVLLQAMNNGLAAWYDLRGKVFLTEKYESVGPILYPLGAPEEDMSNPKKGVRFVTLKGKTGMIDYYGKELLAPKYDAVVRVTDNLYIVNIGGHFKTETYADTLPPDDMQPEGSVVLRTDSMIGGGKYGVVDRKGKELLPARYEYVSILLSTNPWLYYFNVNTGGTQRTLILHRSRYTYDYFSSEGEYSYMQYQRQQPVEGGTWTMLDKNSKAILPGYDEVSLWEFDTEDAKKPGVNLTHTYLLGKKNGKEVLFTASGLPAIQAPYDSVSIWQTPDRRSYAFIVRNGGKLGITDKAGRLVVPCTYDQLWQFGNNAIYNKGGEVWTAQPEQNADDYYSTGASWHIRGGKYGIITWSGKELAGGFDTIIDPVTYLQENSLFFTRNAENVNAVTFLEFKAAKSPLLVKKNGKYGMITQEGAAVMPAELDSVILFEGSERTSALKNGKWGMISLSGKTLIPFNYDQPMRASYDNYGYSFAMKNGKPGLVDTLGAEVIPFVYDKITTGYPYGTKKNIYVVEKNGKLGVYDLSTKKEIIAPVYDHIFASEWDTLLSINIGAKDMNPDVYDNSKYEGGKWGYMTKAGKVLIPAEYDLLTSYNSEAGLFKAGKNVVKDAEGNITGGQWTYFKSSGEQVANGEQLWNATWAGQRALHETPANTKHAWNAANGPLGCDATAFYIDKKGDYWLGTGSSGGVYVSSNKGKSWKETNEGIGPVHVQLMEAIHDTVFIKVIGTGFEEPSEVTYNTLDEPYNIFYFDKAQKGWKAVKDSARCLDLLDTLNVHAVNMHESMESKFLLATAQKNVERYFAGFEFSESGSLLNYAAFGAIKDTVSTIAKGFPKDVFPMHASNVYPVDHGGAVVIGKSGAYKYDSGKISKMGEKGLVASDVTQLVRTGDGSYFMRTGTSDIWYYNDGKWKKLLDAYKEQVKNAADTSLAGYSTGWMNAAPGEKVIFSFCGNIYEMDKTGKRQLLLKQDTLDAYMRVMPISAVRDAQNNSVLHGMAFVAPADADESSYFSYSNDYQFRLFDYDLATKKMKLADTAFYKTTYGSHLPLVFQDKKGNTWACSDDDIMKTDGAARIQITIGLHTQSIAFGDNGEIAIADQGDAIMWLDPAKSEWSRIGVPHRGSIDALGFDKEGHLYAGCNYEFEYYCGGKGKLSDPGFYRLSFTSVGPVWKKLPTGPNERIISIAQHPKGLAVGTCGSGLFILEAGK